MKLSMQYLAKKSIFYVSIIECLLVSCNYTNNTDVHCVINCNGDTLYVCDLHSIKKEITLNLSEIVDDVKLIQLENSDSAIVKPWRYCVTDNFIGVANEFIAPFKLFCHNGDFVCNIGSIGQGPGEYSTTYGFSMNEKANLICLASVNCKFLNIYNFQGEFLHSINSGVVLCKPLIKIIDETKCFVTHIPWETSTFQHVLLQNGQEAKLYAPHIRISAKDSNGNFVGFNNEIWLYENTERINYRISALDTLYTYDIQNERVSSRFTVENHANSFIHYNELPKCFLFDVYDSVYKESYIVFKDNLQAYKLCLINDYCGNIPIREPAKYFINGWYCEMHEPYIFIETVKEYTTSSNTQQEGSKSINNMLNNIDEFGNCILLKGKLK